MLNKAIKTSAVLGLAMMSNTAFSACTDVTRAQLITAATAVVPGDTYLAPDTGDKTPNGGFDLPMWVVMVDESGKVCHVINTSNPTATNGSGIGNNSWLGSRVIAAQKANTANAFSLDYYAISTANLFGTVQTNQSLFGLQHSNPVDAYAAYFGNSKRFGTSNDPMKGRRIGGVNVFGGGLALYNDAGTKKIGAIGVSGDTSCTDHVVAWKIRAALGKATVPRGPTTEMFTSNGGPLNLGGVKGDEMYMDAGNEGATGWEHPACPNTPDHTRNGEAIVGTGPAPIVLVAP